LPKVRGTVVFYGVSIRRREGTKKYCTIHPQFAIRKGFTSLLRKFAAVTFLYSIATLLVVVVDRKTIIARWCVVDTVFRVAVGIAGAI